MPSPVDIYAHVTNNYVDLEKEEIDVALRIGKLKDSNYIQKRLMDAEMILVAGLEYVQKNDLESNFVSLNQLDRYSFLSFRNYRNFKDLKDLNLNPTVHSDSFHLLRTMALNNSGIAVVPNFFVKKDLENKSLIRVLPSWSGGKKPSQVLFRKEKNMPKRIRYFIDHVQKFLGKKT